MYEKQTWNRGDTITEDKLNHVEDGIANAGGILVCHCIFEENDIQPLKLSSQTSSSNILPNDARLDKTWQQIKDADLAIIVIEDSYTDDSEEVPAHFYFKNLEVVSYVRYSYDSEGGEYYVGTTDSWNFVTDSPEGYPVITGGPK